MRMRSWADDRAADAEHQLNDPQERIAQFQVPSSELEAQITELQVQPQALAAVLQRLHAAEGQVRRCRTRCSA